MMSGKINQLVFSGDQSSSDSLVPAPVQGNTSDCIDTTQSQCSPQNPSRLGSKLNIDQPKLKLPSPKNAEDIIPATEKITEDRDYKKNLSKKGLQEAIHFLRENISRSNRLIRQYYIPLPPGILHAHALLLYFDNLENPYPTPESKEFKEYKEAVRFICRVNYLERRFSQVSYENNASTLNESFLMDLAALSKQVYIKEEDHIHSLYIYPGVSCRRIFLRKKSKNIIEKRKDCVYIVRDEWQRTSNKLKFLAKRCFISKELHNNYPRSYGEFLKKALEESCKAKYNQAKAQGNDQKLRAFHSKLMIQRYYSAA